MGPEDGATSTERNSGGVAPRGSGGGSQVMKKGPWTAAEDAILMEYVKKHGEGNWNAVQRNSGLMRCGKSCRLRWANHLRPNLKKGAFTPEEERQIIELHSKFGNKWARMALHLQGRTDNEIKNYWNTRLKRRQRAGLPIYPVDFHPGHHHHHHRQHHDRPIQNQQILPSSSSTSSPNFNPISLLDTMNFPALTTSLRLSNSQPQFKLLRANNGGVALSLPSNLPLDAAAFSPIPVFNPAGVPSFNYDMMNLIIPKSEPTQTHFHVSSENELPSIQSSFQAITPTSSSCNTVNDNMVVPSSDGDNYDIGLEFSNNGNTGLLADVLGESSRVLLTSNHQHKSGNEIEKGKAKIINDYAFIQEPHPLNLQPVFGLTDHGTPTPHLEDSSSGHSSIEMGMKSSHGDVFEEINMVDDDFSSWLDFPVTGTFQEWYGGSDDAVSTDQKPAATDVSNAANVIAADNQREVSCSPVAAIKPETDQDPDPDQDQDQDQDHEWTMGSCCWNNMPAFS